MYDVIVSMSWLIELHKNVATQLSAIFLTLQFMLDTCDQRFCATRSALESLLVTWFMNVSHLTMEVTVCHL